MIGALRAVCILIIKMCRSGRGMDDVICILQTNGGWNIIGLYFYLKFIVAMIISC